jgi:PST family polysaccharide transporter
MYRVTFRAPMGGFWRQFLSPLALTAVLGAVLWGEDILTRGWDTALGLGAVWGMILSLGVKCAVAGILWAGYVQLTGEFDQVGKVKSIIHRR